MRMQAHHIIIDERAISFWDWELKSKNIEFLKGIDPDYFNFIAHSNVSQLETDNKHNAATAIRVAYSHATETLFALIASSIQAPHCPLAWMLNYKNFELINVIGKVVNRENLNTRFKNKNLTWHLLSETVHKHINPEKVDKNRIISGFENLWSKLAKEFIDMNFSYEYNAIKHGLRVSPGGFKVVVCPEISPGVADSPDKAIILGESAFGSSYFVNESIKGTPKHNFRPKRHGRNWDPIHLANRLPFIAMSISNILSWLCVINGEQPNSCKYHYPSDLNLFEEPWGNEVNLEHTTFDINIESEDIYPISKKAIVKDYNK
ncbi:hypothetical protein [Desulfosediminicola flagellatus]|uniref:hypothetical protein n=1 Tax=Desulfosediminicola flagellatus TaxID=2569541 RepID=UPI0010ACF169|nr:hypothetical protein [Desulfosediminicola flagellatus]